MPCLQETEIMGPGMGRVVEHTSGLQLSELLQANSLILNGGGSY